jgi:hypothetical protein
MLQKLVFILCFVKLAFTLKIKKKIRETLQAGLLEITLMSVSDLFGVVDLYTVTGFY